MKIVQLHNNTTHNPLPNTHIHRNNIKYHILSLSMSYALKHI